MSTSNTKPAINPWFIAITVTLATFMELLDSSIANVALPHIAGDLGTSYDEVTWVLTSYLVANAIVLPLSAWLSTILGRKNYYMICVAIFTLASLACGLAPNLETLIFFRIVQGIGGGGLAPIEQSILVDTFAPAKRAAAFGLYSMAIVTAPAIGPPLGGWLTDTFNWRLVFLVNIPIGLLSLYLTNRLVKDTAEFDEARKLAKAGVKASVDWLGIVFVALGFGCLEVVLDRGQRLDWLENEWIVGFLATAAVSLVTGIFWELRHKNPVVEVRLLFERNFFLANCFYFIFGFTLFGSTLLIPQLLESLYGYSATDAGLVLGPGALVIVGLAPLVVKTIPIVGARRYLFIGFSVLTLSMWHYGKFDLSIDYNTFMLARMLQGLGLAFLFVPMSQVAYSFLPPNKNNKASSLTNLFRNLGGSFGISFVTTMLERRQTYHRSIIVEHLNPDGLGVNERLSSYQDQLQHVGNFSLTDSVSGAVGMLDRTVSQQSALLSFMDCFYLLSFLSLTGMVLVFFVKRLPILASGVSTEVH
ncbi:DHA2 family efflux MFS transporter permease subunit [soil metagenome]